LTEIEGNWKRKLVRSNNKVLELPAHWKFMFFSRYRSRLMVVQIHQWQLSLKQR